jgi:hypothetical protein
MIEYDHDTANQHCVCKSDKLLTTVHIEKEVGGYRFFYIRYEKGQVPNQLSGRYTTISAAQRDLERYLRGQPVSKMKRVKERADEREKQRNGSKSESESS